MKLFRGAVDTIKRVYRYEKTTGMDVGALQGHADLCGGVVSDRY